MSASRPSVYTSLGGRAAVERAVSIFYDRVSADKRVNKFFKTADMRRLRLKLAEFIVYAFGGPSEYSGRDLVTVHKPVIKKGATVFHFDIVAAHFIGTLADMGVSKAVQDDVFKVLLTVKPIFPNPLWRRILHRLSRKRRDRHTQDVAAIALPQPSAAASIHPDLQQDHAEGSKISQEDSQAQQVINVSALSDLKPAHAAPIPLPCSSSSSNGCPVAV